MDNREGIVAKVVLEHPTELAPVGARVANRISSYDNHISWTVRTQRC